MLNRFSILAAALGIATIALVAALGAKKGCKKIEPTEPICINPAEDCAGMQPDVDCIGAWQCSADATCEFVCGEPEPTWCDSELDCGDDQVCECSTDCGAFPVPCLQLCQCVDAPKPDPVECDSDTQCATGQSCVCEADCGAWPAPCFQLCTCQDDPKPEPTKCFVGGCSGQLCTPFPDMVSTCEFFPWYQCYSLTGCGNYGAGGGCGWKKTDAFLDCWESYGGPPIL